MAARSRLWAWTWAASLVLSAGAARAEVTLPDGSSIPRDSMNGETQLSTLFSNRGESIDFVQDGFPTPSTFSPLCNFKATMLLRESASDLAVGWYNVDPSATLPPSASEIYEIFSTSTNNEGATITGADIRTNPNYAQGLIGFALIRTPPHFSEAKWNTVCTSCTNPGPWILSVSYRSTVTPNAYYLAFEDGNTSTSGWNNDGDYNDYVMLFEGLACAGDGEPCEVPGQVGVCKDGIQECNNTGTLECKQLTPASDEQCDALDNDCDGETDEGDDLCDDVNLVCSRGQCVPKCGTGEFQCIVPPFTECAGDVCIDPKCKNVDCDAGEVCVEGECRAACDGVTCPVGQACRLGACVDPCAGVNCGDQRVCVNGACVIDCVCAGCDAGNTCDQTTKVCVDDDCVGKSCGTGEYCAPDGSCADTCENATCPAGDVCVQGQCTPAEGSDGTDGADGTAGDGTDGTGGDGSAGDGSGGGGDAGSAPDAGGAGVGTPGGSSVESDSGCGCRVPGAQDHPSRGKLLLALGLLALVVHRRRRR